MPDDYLAHHGIRGQKWGVRRYQNEDGSYTNEGKNRYAKERPSTWKGPDTFRYNRANRRADKGLRRRAKGETITDNSTKAHYGALAVGVAAIAAKKYVEQNGPVTFSYGSTHLGTMNHQTIAIGAAATTALIYGRNYWKNRQIRTSYQRDHHGKNSRWAG